jgi:hypothetical protein
MKKITLEHSIIRNMVYFKITHQTHTGHNFGTKKEPRHFRATNNICLSSSARPEWLSYEKMLYVRGTSKNHDNDELLCSIEDWDLICEAVNQYNRHFEDPLFLKKLDDSLFKI